MKIGAEKYQCLVAGLPEISIDLKKISPDFIEFKNLLKNELSPGDYKLVELLCLRSDLLNLLNFLEETKKPFDPRGNFPLHDINELLEIKEIEAPEGIPSDATEFLSKFIIHFKNNLPLYPGLSWADQANAYYFGRVRNSNNVFLGKWFEFELNLKNLQVAINGAKIKINTDKLIWEDSFFSNELKNSKQRDFGLSKDFKWVEIVVNLYENKDLLSREKDIEMLRWKMLDELTCFHYFSVEVVLSYLLKLDMIERWIKLDKETGSKIFTQLFESLQNNYEFPKVIK